MQEPAATPAIRQVKVEAARKAIDAGTVGTDPQALADKIIESMLKK
jgi:anti-sigma28 factor (negative regulator of flagellin synthesis)